jgi:RNA polymerase sigma-70 factor (ECF subfamily)
MTDGELVSRALRGDARSFTELADRHAPSCLRYATRMLGDRFQAEEVTQDALLRAYKALARYDERMPFRTWLFAILINRCRTARVQHIRRQRRFVSDDASLDGMAVASGADAVELRVHIERALDTLSADQREAFLLRHVEQLEYEEIAAMTGAGVSALKMRVKRACERLRVELADERNVDDAR